MGLAQRSTTDGQTAPGLVCEQAKNDALSDQTRCSNASCSVRSVDLLPFDNEAWATRAIAADAQVSRHRDMYQTGENWLATLRAAIRKVMFYPANILCGSSETSQLLN